MINPKIKVLIVDDVPDIAESLITMCQEMGISDLTVSSNGKLAWETIQAANPPFDLIMSDWTMPEMSGLQLLQNVRADGRFSNARFLMITGQGESQQIIEALGAGATNYLVKPFTSSRLKEKLEVVYSGYTDSQPIKE